ncbi:MAG: hypothetical protein DRN49_01665 [Thaumarchaeota archaeon]|nr:MAG: hypothetical protein DRN49_01665 [Nitrososphaerota archaeon]
MQRRLQAILVLFLTILVISPVLASSSDIWVEDDFIEDNWYKTVGFAVFYEDKITLIAPSTNKTEIWYKTTLDEFNNGTYPTTVYIYVKYNVTYQDVENVDQIFSILLKGSNDVTFDIGLGRYNSTKLYYQARCSETGATEYKSFVSSLPSEFIMSYDGNLIVFYEPDGDIIETIETTDDKYNIGTGFKEFGFNIWKTDHVDILGYAVADSLTDLTSGYASRKTSELLYDFIPLIVAVAMVGMCVGLVKKFAR